MATPTRPQCVRGASMEKPLQLRKGHESILWYPKRRNLLQSKTYELELPFVKACSALCAIHQRKYEKW
jgi:hypothetical protein